MDPYDSLCNIPSHAVLSTFSTVLTRVGSQGPKVKKRDLHWRLGLGFRVTDIIQPCTSRVVALGFEILVSKPTLVHVRCILWTYEGKTSGGTTLGLQPWNLLGGGGVVKHVAPSWPPKFYGCTIGGIPGTHEAIHNFNMLPCKFLLPYRTHTRILVMGTSNKVPVIL